MILRPGFCGGVVLALLVHSGGEFGTVDELDLVRELHSSCTPSDPRRFRSARCNHRVNLAQNCRGEGHRSDFVRILEAEFRCDFLFSLEDEKGTSVYRPRESGTGGRSLRASSVLPAIETCLFSSISREVASRAAISLLTTIRSTAPYLVLLHRSGHRKCIS